MTVLSASTIAFSASDETNVPTQEYSTELIDAGRIRFAADCGFCHGRDAAGASGPDLVRSELVAEDINGDLISEVVRNGRGDAGMPSFASITNDKMDSLVAFIYDQILKDETAVGGRRSVEPADLETGNAELGQVYFNEACTGCHSAEGDLLGIASRMEGLPLLRRMLYPGSESRAAADNRKKSALTVTTSDGEIISGALVYQDEFTIALTDSSGQYRSWSARNVSFTIIDPLVGHVEQLGRYTDADMHNVLAYIQTLR